MAQSDASSTMTPAGPSADNRRLSLSSAAVVFVFCLSLLLVNPSGLVLTRHEILAAQPAREMLAGGHWIIPHFAGVPRVNKPPTMSWLIAGSMWVFQTESPWAARLPANIAGAILCVIIAAIAARLLGNFGGLVAGLSAATSYYMLVQARLSEADIPMAACIAMSYLAFIRGALDPPGNARVGVWSVVFHACVGLSVLFKGVGPAFILPACILWTALFRNRRGMRLLIHPLGIVALLIVLLPWPIAAWRTYPPIIEAWHREMFQRVTGELGEELGRADPWYEYFIIIPMMLLPWIVLVLPAGVAGWRHRSHRNPVAALLLCWFICGLAILTLSAWKNRHYSIPILPSANVAGSAGMLLWAAFSAARPARHARVVAAVVGLPLLVAAGIMPWLDIPFRAEAAALAVVLAGGVAVTMELLARRRESAAVAAVFVTAWLLIAVALWRIIPATDLHRPTADFARRVDATIGPGQTVYLLGLGEHASAYYLHRPLVRIDRLEDAARMLPREESAILAPASARAALELLGTVTVRDEMPTLARRQPPEQRLTFFVLSPRVGG